MRTRLSGGVAGERRVNLAVPYADRAHDVGGHAHRGKFRVVCFVLLLPRAFTGGLQEMSWALNH